MNYLAHLHLADKTETSLVGNLMGDFFKGSIDQANLPEALSLGIQLHRKVDSFTDAHPFVKSLKRQMPEHRRYGGIIIDVLFDHELAVNFHQYHDKSLSDFVSRCTRAFEIDPRIMSERFVSVLTHMQQSNWLVDYQRLDVIEQVLNRIGTRLSKPVELGRSVAWYIEQKSLFSEFSDFYNDLVEFALQETEILRSAHSPYLNAKMGSK